MYNKVILIGRICNDLELKSTANGVPVTSFRLAVNRAHDREKTDFLDVVTWRSNAEFLNKYFSKGRAIGVEGTLQTREYTDKNGNKRNAVETVADRIFFVGESKSQTKNAEEENGAENRSNYEAMSDEDLPF